jgi:hypothetical protein
MIIKKMMKIALTCAAPLDDSELELHVFTEAALLEPATAIVIRGEAETAAQLLIVHGLLARDLQIIEQRFSVLHVFTKHRRDGIGALA